jgi:hypothetical protein
MKKLLLLFLLTFALSNYGQVVTNDTQANITLSSQLLKSAEQLKQLEKNYDLIKKAEEKYEKINSLVSSVSNLKEIISLSNEAYSNVSLVLENTNLKGKSRQILIKNLQKLTIKISEKTLNISKVVKEGFFTMSDKERMDLFQKERNSIFSLVSRTRGYANPYRKR